MLVNKKQGTKNSKRTSAKTKGKKKSFQKVKKLSLRTKLFFVLGSLFLVTSVGWNLNQTIQLTFFTPKVAPIQKTQSVPIQIIVDKVGINLPIAETAITNGVWQIAPNAVSHLNISARPGENGPIILYDHNTDDKFGPIRWLSTKDTIQIKTADGKSHTYKITQMMTVAPDKMEIFTQQRDESLILYTCDGFADLERFVIIAKP